ncbi:MAG: JAB domain-containing protein [Dethiobacteraceae bacterium]|jgi:DNA repair protein RadC
MKRINIFTIIQVKEKGALYELDSKFINSPEDANHAIRTVLRLQEKAVEQFWVITLTTKNEIAGLHPISVGSLNASLVHPREVFKPAYLNNAASIMLTHNHPSGDPTPSREDITITKRLCEAGELLGIQVLDHIIVGEERFESLRAKGLISR